MCRGEVQDAYYTFDTSKMVLGADLKSNEQPTSGVEDFALSSNVYSNINNVNLTKLYSIGRRNTSNILSKPLYGGKNNCVEYPDVVYKQLN